MPQEPRTALVSLADLQSAGVRLRPLEAATIARHVIQQVLHGELPGVPSVHVIRLARDGQIAIEGPVETGGRGVPRAAQLLEDLLPGFDAPPEFRVPGALRLMVARGLRTLDLPAYPSLDAFSDALVRFSGPDSTAVVRSVVQCLEKSIVPAEPLVGAGAESEPLEAEADEAEPAGATLARMPPAAGVLTISDIRRARRATGLTLGDIATRSRIPAWLLRELEWGYFRNWPAGHYGRTQLIRYARAAGLDDHVVTRTVWPLVEREARTDGQAVVPAMEWTEAAEWDADVMVPPSRPIIEVTDAELLPAVPAATAARPASRRRRALAVLAIPALLAIGLLPGLLQRSGPTAEPVAIESQARIEDSDARPDADPLVVSGSEAPGRAVAVTPPGPEPEPIASTPGDQGTAETRTPAEPQPTPREPVPSPRADAPTASGSAQPANLPESPAYSPAFTSVGTAMFYHTGNDGQSKLMRADADSRGAVLRVTSVVDDDANNFHPRPSPDGAQIAFDSDRDGERAVYIAESDGQNVRRVSGDGFAAIPSWSPDGRTLAYVRAEDGRPRVWNIWLTDLTSGETRRLTSHRVGQPWGASWFPDGRRIAYSHETRLIVRDLETGAERVHESPIKGRLVRTPAVSPDGRRIMFQVHRDGAWLLNVGDGSMRKVLSDPTAEEYTWAPDGRRVAYHSRQSGAWGVWVMASR